MDWKTLIAEIQAAGMSQTQIAARLGKSQAWVSAAANGLYGDLKWNDGEAVLSLHASILPTSDPTSNTDSPVNKEAA